MALGIAAATTIFSVVYGVLFRPLPFPDPDRIVLIEGWNDQFSGRQTRANYSLADLSYWRDRRQTFDALSLTTFESMSLATSGGSEAVLANVVTQGFFEVVHGKMAAGRLFTTADDDAPVAVITARLWRRVLNEATDAIGSRLLLNSRAYVIVGVIDESFRAYDTVTDVWLTAGFALAVNPALDSARSGSFSPIGRLKKGVSIAQAQSDVDAISRALAHDRPEQYARVRANVVGLQGRLIGDVRPALLILLAAVGLVLIVACANVANLLLTRNVFRARGASEARSSSRSCPSPSCSSWVRASSGAASRA
jgi:putative ABC transport system permease protein